MNQERTWYLLSVQLSGEATPEELEELSTLLKQQPELGLRADIIRNLWNGTVGRKGKPVAVSHFDKHLQRLSNHLAQPALQFDDELVDSDAPQLEMAPSRNRLRWLWVGAAVAASVLVVFLVFSPTKKTESKPVASNTISTRPGSKSKVELPDGTQVWLNADSKLTYAQNFIGNTREVTLTGEAFFDVAHINSIETGQKIPFIIHTNSIDIKVLGTAFNVRSYPGEKTIETALIRGSVEVTLHNSADKKIVLKPDEKLVVKNDNAVVVSNKPALAESADNEPMMTLSKIHRYKGDTTAHYETLWVKNKLAFENETFDRMLPELERWYNVSIVLKNETLKGLHFTGVFENKSLADVMDALSLARGFHYEIKGAEVTIW
ncbi:FecR family protein [Niastella sp. OAS944]|uniref:FecR family protein n=1 Tax=Niastella sp. OAS944 TaxID=2664089 RepID=UPI0034909979|nr:ferric-dicitrate binding protein FerR (iron transport regulator) [Chitinophagaceae bacterium OAS944]